MSYILVGYGGYGMPMDAPVVIPLNTDTGCGMIWDESGFARFAPSSRSSLLFRSCNSRSWSMTFCLYSSCSCRLWMAVGCAVMRGNSIRLLAQQQVKMKQDKSEIPETTSSTRYRLHQLHQWQLLLEVLECEGEHCNEFQIWRSIKHPSLTYQTNGTSGGRNVITSPLRLPKSSKTVE